MLIFFDGLWPFDQRPGWNKKNTPSALFSSSNNSYTLKNVRPGAVTTPWDLAVFLSLILTSLTPDSSNSKVLVSKLLKIRSQVLQFFEPVSTWDIFFSPSKSCSGWGNNYKNIRLHQVLWAVQKKLRDAKFKSIKSKRGNYLLSFSLSSSNLYLILSNI